MKVQEKKRKVVVLCSRPQNKKNVKLGTSIVQRRLRNRDRCAKLLCFKSKPIAFLSFSLPSPSSLLKLLMYTDNLSAGRRENGFCQERLKLVEARLQIASTHVVGSYANLFEQKKVFTREESRIPTGFLFGTLTWSVFQSFVHHYGRHDVYKKKLGQYPAFSGAILIALLVNNAR